MDKIQILLVDDEPLLLESLEIILTLNGMEIAGMAQDGVEALNLLQEKSCELALVDLNMKGMGGIELISHMKSEYPEVKILVLTTFYDDRNITRAIASGADGYLLKDSGKDAILGAIGQIMGGRNVVDGKVMQRLAVLIGRQAADSAGSAKAAGISEAAGSAKAAGISEAAGAARPVGELGGTGAARFQGNGTQIICTQDFCGSMTRREKEICTLLARGMDNRQIAETLYISEGTVKNYVSSIYDKTGIHDRAKLAVALRV